MDINGYTTKHTALLECFLYVQSITQGPLDAKLGPYRTKSVHNNIRMINGPRPVQTEGNDLKPSII